MATAASVIHSPGVIAGHWTRAVVAAQVAHHASFAILRRVRHRTRCRLRRARTQRMATATHLIRAARVAGWHREIRIALMTVETIVPTAQIVRDAFGRRERRRRQFRRERRRRRSRSARDGFRFRDQRSVFALFQ